MSRCSACWLALAVLSLLRPAAAADATAELKRSSDGFRVTNAYERDNFEVDLQVNYDQPGTVLDTVGIDAAPVGSFTLAIGPDGKVSFSIYDPRRQGWNVLTNPEVLTKGEDHRLILRVSGGRVVLRVDRELAQADCPTPLSGTTVYLGDYRPDDHWGEKYRIHRGMVGTVTIKYWGVGRQAAPTTTPAPTPTPTPPTTAPATTGGGGPGLSRAFTDETGTLSAAQVQLIRAQLYRLQQEQGWGLGIVWATPDGIETKAKQYRDQWVAQAWLPPVSGVFVASGNQWYWQYNSQLAKVLTFQQVDAAWQAVRQEPPETALPAFVARLGGWSLANTPTNGTRVPPADTPVTPPTPTTPPVANDPSTPGTSRVETAVAGVVQALKAGNAKVATGYLHPDLQAAYGQALAQHPELMAKLATLLSTRRFVMQAGSTAEYEVTDGGRKYPVTFLLVDGRWVLSSF